MLPYFIYNESEVEMLNDLPQVNQRQESNLVHSNFNLSFSSNCIMERPVI